MEKNVENVESLKNESENKTPSVEELQAKLAEVEKTKFELEAKYKGENLALKAKLGTLEKHLSSANLVLPEEIENLKLTDPEAYYTKRREFEIKNLNEINSKLTEAEKLALEEERKNTNTRLLNEFKQENPQITEDFINFEVPHRIKFKLDTGEINFKEFLDEVKKYYNKGKAVYAGSSVKNQPDLSKMGSGEGLENKTLDYESFVKNYSSAII